MTLEELESRKQELQGELSKVENQLVEALKTVESLSNSSTPTGNTYDLSMP